ncbi:phosphopantetheine-binding protein, partial [Mycobacterium tuberculosis]
RLPRHMIPVAIQPIAALPLTANGKIDRRKLGGQALRSEPGRSAVADGAILSTVRRLVREIARIEGPADASLLDLGLSSVEAIRLANALEGAFGVRPDIRLFYATPTMDWLAGACTAEAPSPTLTLSIEDPAEREAFKRRRLGRRRFDAPSSTVSLQGAAPEPLEALLA